MHFLQSKDVEKNLQFPARKYQRITLNKLQSRVLLTR